jgi:hypothetical protein
VLHLATFHKIGWFGILSRAERTLKQGIVKTPGSSGLYISSFEVPIAAAEAEVNKATSTKLPIWCKQFMHLLFVLMKRISPSPNHSPQTSAFPNPHRPD